MTVAMTNIIFLFVGAGLGVAFFTALKINSDIYITNGLSWIGLMLHLTRFVITVLIFWFISGFGAMPLLISLGGFLLGRFITMRYIRRGIE